MCRVIQKIDKKIDRWRNAKRQKRFLQILAYYGLSNRHSEYLIRVHQKFYKIIINPSRQTHPNKPQRINLHLQKRPFRQRRQPLLRMALEIRSQLLQPSQIPHVPQTQMPHHHQVQHLHRSNVVLPSSKDEQPSLHFPQQHPKILKVEHPPNPKNSQYPPLIVPQPQLPYSQLRSS